MGDLVAEARAAGSAVIVSGHDTEDPIAADRVLRVGGGLLHEETVVAPSPAVTATPAVGRSAVAVTLRDPGGGRDAAFLVAQHDVGVGAGPSPRLPGGAGRAGAVLDVLVAPGDVDAFLADAIAAGWSVLRVLAVAPGGDDAPR